MFWTEASAAVDSTYRDGMDAIDRNAATGVVHVRSPSAQQILRTIQSTPTPLRDLHKHVGLNDTLVRYHVTRLADQGLVVLEGNNGLKRVMRTGLGSQVAAALAGA